MSDERSLDSLDGDVGETDISGSEKAFLERVARGSTGGEQPSFADSSAPDLAWAAPRFDIRRRLGAGGFGAVYEAFDTKRNALVALKTPTRRDPAARRWFKEEFRALADLDHPNLVRLYELQGDDAAWFFTMELVVGQNARSYVRSAKGGFDEPRLRSLFEQLAVGLRFLHDAGRLHRDVKPSNVIVDGEGRAVLLDFGLAIDLRDDALLVAAGTPPYMAPEQHDGGPIDAAADWYSLGVMLFEALVGRLPFEGTASEIANAKRGRDAPAPADHAAGVPVDLNRLCVDLLERDPRRRPTGDQVIERLRGRIAEAEREPPRRSAPFVGRRDERRRLDEALAIARDGRTSVALVHAPSGMGKTALVRQFLEETRAKESHLLVLAGRCFEQESLPDKTLDGVVEALSLALSRTPPSVLEAVLPQDVAALVRAFPALARVPGLSLVRAETAADGIDLRRRAIAALRELLVRMGERSLLVLFFDDLQWGDAEGSAVLAALLRPPAAPAMLVVLAYRSDEAERSEGLRSLLPVVRSSDEPIDHREIALERLDAEDADVLARSALGERRAALSERVATIARESDGSPLFLLELCRFSAENDGVSSPTETPSLDAMLSARVDALSADARRLLEAIAVAGQPVDRAVAAKACDLGDGEPGVIALLRARSLLRARTGDAGDAVETFHDRIRETVIDGLAAPARAVIHGRLAEALLEGGDADPQAIATHLEGAGDGARAGGYWADAADRALAALGFEHAARLYRRAISALAPDSTRVRALHESLGFALGHCGRGPEAAAAYLAAADGAPADKRLEMRQLAAHHSLVSGNLDDGLRAMRALLATVGLSMPRTRVGALLQGLVLLLLFQLRFRTVAFRAAGAIVAPKRLARADTWSAAAMNIAHWDPARAVYFHMRALELAASSGDPYRLLRELIPHRCFLAAQRGEGVPSRFEVKLEARVDELLEVVRTEEGGTGPRLRAAHGLVELGRGVVFFLRVQSPRARGHLERAEAELSRCPLRLGGEITMARVQLLVTLFWLGAWKELVRRERDFIADARARDDRLAEIQLGAYAFVKELSADEPELALRALEGAFRRSREDRTNELENAGNLALATLYRDAGAGSGALAAYEMEWAQAGRWLASQVSSGVRVHRFSSCGAVHLAAAQAADERQRELHLRSAERSVASLEAIETGLARAFAHLLRAGVARGRGDTRNSKRSLADAEAAFELLGMGLWVAATRRRRGEALGGAAGRELVESADAAMRAQDIRNPARMAAALAPGPY